VTAPTGSTAFRGSGLSPGASLAFSWGIADSFGLGVLLGGASDKAEYGRRYWTGQGGITAGASLPGGLGVSVGLSAAQVAPEFAGGNVFVYELCATYAISDNVQVDVATYFPANRNAPLITATGGISIRVQ